MSIENEFVELACVVCSRPVTDDDFAGFFFPKKHAMARIGTPKGKYRVIGYRLCRSCKDQPDWVAKVEAAIFEMASTQ